MVYRDGVGDGQLAAVYEHEIKQCMEVFKRAGFQQRPKFAFVVVKKRINSRFFARSGRLTNPKPGLTFLCFYSLFSYLISVHLNVL